MTGYPNGTVTVGTTPTQVCTVGDQSRGLLVANTGNHPGASRRIRCDRHNRGLLADVTEIGATA